MRPNLRSRRGALLGAAAACVAAIGVIWQAVPTLGLSEKLQFVPDPKLPVISFGKARSAVIDVVKSEFEESQRDLKVQYSEEDMQRIRDRVWDAVQLTLIQHYRPSEQPKLTDKDDRGTIGTTGGGRPGRP
jgi:hypothetical protein